MNKMYIYDAAFQTLAATGSAHAARRIVAVLGTILPVRSVIDIGCARGTWLREWQAQCADEILGLDGDFVDRSKLEIDPACFVVHDLAARFEQARRFDLAQSLEVAEHLAPERAASFVADLVALAPVVLFSAAPPGQGGENHLNEQPGEYWRRLFQTHDYVAIDCLRPLLTRENGIPAWYRYNIVLYVHRDSLDRISPFARQFQLSAHQTIGDPSPLPYKIRKRIIRSLPRSICDRLAQMNARRVAAGV